MSLKQVHFPSQYANTSAPVCIASRAFRFCVLLIALQVKITPDERWGATLHVTPARVGNYMQYVDAESVTVWCRKLNETTAKTLKQLIENLSVSQCMLRTKRVTFTGESFYELSRTIPLITSQKRLNNA